MMFAAGCEFKFDKAMNAMLAFCYYPVCRCGGRVARVCISSESVLLTTIAILKRLAFVLSPHNEKPKKQVCLYMYIQRNRCCLPEVRMIRLVVIVAGAIVRVLGFASFMWLIVVYLSCRSWLARNICVLWE